MWPILALGQRLKVTNMNKHSLFWDKASQKYFQKPVKNQKAYERKLELIKQLLRPDSNVLEVGCGTGSTALTLSTYVNSYDAVDFSRNMVAIAEERANNANITNIHFKTADIEEYIPIENSYDIVMAHSVLHLIDNSEYVVKNLLKSLRPGGHLVLSLVLLDKLSLPLKLVLSIASRIGLVPHLVFSNVEPLLCQLEQAQCSTTTSIRVDNNNLFLIVKKKGKNVTNSA